LRDLDLAELTHPLFAFLCFSEAFPHRSISPPAGDRRRYAGAVRC